MATQTTNLGLTKPGYDEAADIVPAVNNNMDTLDEKIGPVPENTSIQAQITANAQAIAKLDESIAIVSNGNTHAAIAAGQYVYIKGHGTLAEGLYTANSAISANATLSNSNVTAVPGGGLNALNSKITTQQGTISVPSGVTNQDATCFKSGNIVVLNGRLSISDSIAGTGEVICTLPVGFRPSYNIIVRIWCKYGTEGYGFNKFYIKTDGTIESAIGGSSITENVIFHGLSFCI